RGSRKEGAVTLRLNCTRFNGEAPRYLPPTRRADILRIPHIKNLRLSPNEIPGASTSSRGIVILPVIRRGLNLPGQKAKIYAGHHFGQPEGRHGEINLTHRLGGRRHGGWRAGVHVGDRSPRHDLELGGASS